MEDHSYSFCAKRGIDHFQELFGKSPRFPWQHNIVKSEKSVPDYDFYKKHTNIFLNNTTVCLDQIKGTMHCDYVGKEWIEMFGCLKKSMAHSEKNAKEWISEKSSGIILNQYGDQYFISGDGNHRTCYAKFLGLKDLVVGTIQVYELDQSHLNFHKQLKQLKELKLHINEWSDQYYNIQVGDI